MYVEVLGKEGEGVVVISEREDRGYNIGVRIVDEFAAKSNIDNCKSFQETMETVAKVSSHVSREVT